MTTILEVRLVVADADAEGLEHWPGGIPFADDVRREAIRLVQDRQHPNWHRESIMRFAVYGPEDVR